MARTLTERERNQLCLRQFRAHLVKCWDMYGPVAEIAVTMRSLRQISEQEIESVIKPHLDRAIVYTGLKNLPNVFNPSLGVTFDSLYLLIVWVCLNIKDHTKGPESFLTGERVCK